MAQAASNTTKKRLHPRHVPSAPDHRSTLSQLCAPTNLPKDNNTVNTMKTSTLLLLLLVVVATSAESLRRSIEEIDSKHECELDQDENKDTGMTEEVKFKCKAKTEDSVSELKDEIKFKVSTDDEGQLKVEVEYEQEIETEESETETETNYEITYGSLLEFKPAGSSVTGAYDFDSTTIVNETPLTMGSFGAVADDGSSYTFSIASTDGAAVFTFTISRGGDNEHVTANKMKIDFELKDYEWTATDTNMALLSTIESQREIKIEFEDDEESEDASEIAVKAGPGSKKTEEVTISFAEAVESTGVNVFGEYTWAKDATVRSVNDTATADIVIEVIATSPVDGSDVVAFSFVGDAARMAEDIYWDPTVGVAYAASSAVASAIIGSSLALLVGATLMLLF